MAPARSSPFLWRIVVAASLVGVALWAGDALPLAAAATAPGDDGGVPLEPKDSGAILRTRNPIFPRFSFTPSGAKQSFPRRVAQVCAQVDIPQAAPGLSFHVGVFGELASSIKEGAGERRWKSIKAGLSFAVQGSVFFANAYVIATGEVSISSPRAATHKDMLRLFSKAFATDVLRRTTSRVRSGQFSTMLLGEKRQLAEALGDARELLGPDGKPAPELVDAIAAGADFARAAAERCIQARAVSAREALAGIKGEMETRAVKPGMFGSWRLRRAKYSEFGWRAKGNSRLERLKGLFTRDAPRWDEHTWALMMSQVQFLALRFTHDAERCVAESLFGDAAGAAASTAGSAAAVEAARARGCDAFPVKATMPWSAAVAADMIPAAKEVLAKSASAAGDTVTLYPRLLCMVLEAAPRTDWLSEEAEDERLALATQKMDEEEDADTLARARKHGAPADDEADVGDGDGDGDGEGDGDQLDACVRAGAKELPGGDVALDPAGTCDVFAEGADEDDITDYAEGSLETDLSTGTASNVAASEFNPRPLMSRTFPDINTIAHGPCSGAQLNGTKADTPNKCWIRVPTPAANAFPRLWRDARALFDAFGEQRRAVRMPRGGSLIGTAGDTRPLPSKASAAAMVKTAAGLFDAYAQGGWSRADWVARKAIVTRDDVGASAPDTDVDTDAPAASVLLEEHLLTAHRLGAALAGWLVSPLADAAGSLAARAQEKVDELQSAGPDLEIAYSFTGTISAAGGQDTVGLCTPDRNPVQIDVSVGLERKATLTVDPLSDPLDGLSSQVPSTALVPAPGRAATSGLRGGAKDATVAIVRSPLSASVSVRLFPHPSLAFTFSISPTGTGTESTARTDVLSQITDFVVKGGVSLWLLPAQLGISSDHMQLLMSGTSTLIAELLRPVVRFATSVIVGLRRLRLARLLLCGAACADRAEQAEQLAGRLAEAVASGEGGAGSSPVTAAGKKRAAKAALGTLVAGAGGEALKALGLGALLAHNRATAGLALHLTVVREKGADALKLAARVDVRTRIGVPFGWGGIAGATVYGVLGSSYDLSDMLTDAFNDANAVATSLAAARQRGGASPAGDEAAKKAEETSSG